MSLGSGVVVEGTMRTGDGSGTSSAGMTKAKSSDSVVVLELMSSGGKSGISSDVS